ncbi:MAG: LLM class F420-dependent oxidoreductase [Chloroflexi bacterium]|nr:LLM class F420-dependent oxidoreductase [Chloroflexota bacterium]
MRFSAWPGSATKWEGLLDLCRHVERTGWDGLWVADHFMPNQADTSGPVQEVWTVLAAIGATVPRVRIGSLVSGNTYRNPAVLAKQAAQVDIVSGGRLVLGIGAAWQENEHTAYGIPFYTVGGRLRRLEEAVQIIKSLFTEEQTTFKGRYYELVDAPLAPKPVQRPHPPILIGGGGEQVTLRLAAQYADEWNVWGAPEVLKQKGEVLERHCEAVGRDPKSIRRSANALVFLMDDPKALEAARARGGRQAIFGNVAELQETMGRYVEAGVDELIVPDFNLGREVGQRKEAYDRFIEEVAPAFR